MADFTDRIKLIVEVAGDKAGKGLSDIKSGIGEADGAFGKMKAGAKGAFSFIADNAGLSATAAAGAIVAFGKQSIAAFTELANAAEDFSATSGASLEDASRWIEVSGDLGVSADAVSAAMGRLNREAATGALDKFGINTQDANERLLQTLEHINAIPNAADRAKAQFELLGKGGAALAPLMANVDTLRERLADVEKAKIIDEKKAADARAFQDNIDNLNDKLDDLKNSLGNELVGAFNDAFSALNNFTSAIPGLDGGLSDIISKVTEIATSPLRNLADGFNTVTDAQSSLTDRARGFGQMVAGSIPGPLGSWAGNLLDVESAQDKAKAATDASNESIQEQAKAAKDAADALDALLSATLSQFSSQLALEDSANKSADAIAKYTDANTKAAASNFGNKDATAAAASAMNDAEQAALKQAAAAAKLQEDNAKLNGTQWDAADSASAQANVLRTLAGGLGPNDPLRAGLLGYASQLEQIPPTKHTTVTADTSQASQMLDNLMGKIRQVLSAFSGALVTGKAAQQSLSSAAGQSASAPASSGLSVVPMAPVAAPRAAPATVINLSVQVAPLTHPAEVGRQISDYLDAFYRRNGTKARALP